MKKLNQQKKTIEMCNRTNTLKDDNNDSFYNWENEFNQTPAYNNNIKWVKPPEQENLHTSYYMISIDWNVNSIEISLSKFPYCST